MGSAKPTKYRFSFGPWNVHTGADPFGPSVRAEFSFNQKMRMYKELGFEGVATMCKHFPGGGPQREGLAPHHDYGREQVYPGDHREGSPSNSPHPWKRWRGRRRTWPMTLRSRSSSSVSA